jgi:hypothetical protein
VNTFNVWAALLFSVLTHPLASADSAVSAVSSIYHYHPLPENLGSSGQPTAEQFAAIRAEGFDVVINLAMPDSENAIAEEGRMVSENAMTYVHIPVPWDAPKGRSPRPVLWRYGCNDKPRQKGLGALCG